MGKEIVREKTVYIRKSDIKQIITSPLFIERKTGFFSMIKTIIYPATIRIFYGLCFTKPYVKECNSDEEMQEVMSRLMAELENTETQFVNLTELLESKQSDELLQ